MSKKKHPSHHAQADTQGIKIIQKNKKAFFEYEILDKYECGIMLQGAEVKSIRANHVQFADSFATIKNNILTLHNMHISPYKFHTTDLLDPMRIRTLLVHKKELNKITRLIEEKGRTLVPLMLYLKKGLIKIEMGVGRGKKLYDKKESIKRKTAEREAQREIKRALKE